jgi:Tfp pilus assembly protein PilO
MSIFEKFNLTEIIESDSFNEKLDIIRQYQHYFYIGITFILSIQLIFTLILPNSKTFTENQEQVKQFERSLNLRKKQTENKENIIYEENRLQLRLAETKAQFFSKKDLEKFSISELPKIAQKYQISISNINFSKKEPLEYNLFKTPVSLQCTGSFFNLMDFIQEIENSQKSINISSIKIDRKTINPVTLTIRLNLNLISLENKP